MEISAFQNYIIEEKVKLSHHAVTKCSSRNIFTNEIEEAILNGSIIEEYPDDKPFPSCLIYGRTKSNRPLHVCLSDCDDYAFIITVYEPNVDKDVFEEDLKTRKKEEK